MGGAALVVSARLCALDFSDLHAAVDSSAEADPNAQLEAALRQLAAFHATVAPDVGLGAATPGAVRLAPAGGVGLVRAAARQLGFSMTRA